MSTLRSRLPEIAAELRPKVSQAVSKGADLVVEGARERVPVGPEKPHLRDAIHKERIGPAEYAVVAGDKEVFWGHLVEHGTVHSAPHPFLVPAAEALSGAIEALVAESLRGL